MEHHFDVDLATKYGMLEAVLLNHFQFWTAKNEANGRNYHDGHFWTYNSAKALHKLFPYASERKIRNAIKRLQEEGLVITGNYNQSAYDRTMWYALTETAVSILQKRQMEDAKMSNQGVKKVTPIPDNNPDDKTNTIIASIVDYLNQKAGTRYRATTRDTKAVIQARINEGFTEEDFHIVIDKKVKQWKGTEMEQYIRPHTLFGTKFEGYLNQTIVKEEKKSNQPEPPRYKEFEPTERVDAVPMPEATKQIQKRLKGIF